LIIVYHKNNQISSVISEDKSEVFFDRKTTIASGIGQLAVRFPKSKMVWCNEAYQENINWDLIESLLHHNKMVLSYSLNELSYLGKKIGYVEESPFININKKVCYPTWQMSSDIGIIHSSVLIAIQDKIKWDANFDYYLNSVAKVCMPLGLFCYSEPKLLLTDKAKIISKQSSIYTLFKFVKQHYKPQWVFLLLLNLLVYEKKFHFFPFLYALFFKNRNKNKINFDAIEVLSNLKVVNKATINVIIPTIGRSNYLYDVLCDLKKQTHLLKNVIIVEQNPTQGSASELNFLTTEKWPFIIKHTFTHQAGACNARNIALEQVENEWVFLADDDIRIKFDFVEKALEQINNFGTFAVSFRCFQKGQNQIYSSIFQWASFGSGCSLVLACSLKNCTFNMGYEFGFGEDADFGIQLRNQGVDVLYLPEPSILHLKAPMGGFRTKPELHWQNDSIQPKPSPTVMLYQITHNTKEQTLGYKTILFFKYYKFQKIKNPQKYYIYFQKQWHQSVFWANQLKRQNEV